MARKKGFLKNLVKGGLHRDLGIPQDKPIPTSRINKELKTAKGRFRKRLLFAKVARTWKHK